MSCQTKEVVRYAFMTLNLEALVIVITRFIMVSKEKTSGLFDVGRGLPTFSITTKLEDALIYVFLYSLNRSWNQEHKSVIITMNQLLHVWLIVMNIVGYVYSLIYSAKECLKVVWAEFEPWLVKRFHTFGFSRLIS